MDSRILNHDIKISVVMPVYNTEKYVKRCVESVLQQTYRNIELIIVDDCSPGNIKEIAQYFANADSRVQIISHEKNKGLFRARLTGAEHATGEYIAFIDSDDYVTNDYYHTLLEKAETQKADIAIGHTVYENEDDRQYIHNFHDACFEFDVLSGDDVRKHFFEQKGQCYSWHTIWNKIYKKSLWDQCAPYYEKMPGHVIMTEDIAFSTVLFYFSKCVVTVSNDAYFYCANENASTNSEGLSFPRFKKNMQDIQAVFDFGEEFLRNVKAEKWIQEDFREFRRYYARIWRNLPNGTYIGIEKKQSLDILKEFCPEENRGVLPEDNFFALVTTPWRGGLEGFKEKIAKSSDRYVSFDIFDTLIQRPFYEPVQLFQLMNKTFEQIVPSNMDFSTIRIQAESYTRKKYGKIQPGWQDVNLNEIYEGMGELYGFPTEILEQLKKKEEELEVRFCKARNAGKELYETALLTGKKVIIVSDMYLTREVIEQILHKNGYCEYEKLYLSSELRKTKHTGAIYDYVKKDLTVLDSEHIYHIGDTWINDYENAKKAGFDALFFPKAREVFENKIHGLNTNDCSNMSKIACSITVKPNEYYKSIGYACMISMIYNKYFDNPFRTFNPNSDFNVDPNFIGYYVVGMHMIGLAKWITDQCRKKGVTKIHFLARDGFLPMQAYQIWNNGQKKVAAADYMYASRKAVMTGMIRSKYDFYNLPIEYHNHTPKTLLTVLSFAAQRMPEEEIKNICKINKFNYEKSFVEYDEYIRFMDMFLKEIYSREMFEENQKLAKEYYSNIKEGEIAFDMGYSGRIQNAISQLAGRGVDVLFIHQENGKAEKMERMGKYEISNYYDYTPYVSGLLREHLLSDYKAGCSSFERVDGKVLPKLTDEEKNYQDIFVIDTIQKNALKMVKDFTCIFNGYMEYLPFRSTEVSFPFEGYLRNSSYLDRKIFAASYFEDMVYGACNKIKIEDFINRTIPYMAYSDRGSSYIPVQNIMNMLEKKNKIIKALVIFILDKNEFKHIVGDKVRNNRFLYNIGKKAWKFYSKIFN